MYTNRLMVENYLQRDLSEHEQAMLEVLNRAVKIWIDRKTNSRFDKVDPTGRFYDGGTGTIDIDPCTDITAVWAVDEWDNQTFEYTRDLYFAEPINEPVKNELRKRHGCFDNTRIRVTARFSEWDGGTPGDIETVATVLVAGVINQGKNASSGGNVASESLEGHSITYDTSDTTLEGIASSNPGVKGILEMRRELLVG